MERESHSQLTEAPSSTRDVWVVGVTPIPEWVTEMSGVDVSVDDHGNAYFQFEDRATIVPKGGGVYRQGNLLHIGDEWQYMEPWPKGALSRGVLYIPEELPE